MAPHFYYCCTGLLILLGPNVLGQQLAGRVVDAETGKPVPYASVGLLGTAQGTTSNAEGEFELPAAKLPGRLVVSELSHRTDTLAVTGAQPVLVRLQPSAVALPEVQLGSYTAELVKKAYRQLLRTNQATYGQAFYRQITRLDDVPTEVQEMVWYTKTSSVGVVATAPSQGRYASKKALLHFKDFSKLTKAISITTLTDDSANHKQLLSLNPTAGCTLRLLGVTQDGNRELVEVGFADKTRPDEEHGSLLIDASTYQLLRFRLTAPFINVSTKNPAFKLTRQQTALEWVFRPAANGTTVLDHCKVEYEGTMKRPLKPDMHVQAVAFTVFYDVQTTPGAGVDYRPYKPGPSDMQTIKALAYDPIFWQNNSVVKRTPLEEATIRSFEQQGAFGTMLAP